MGTVPVPAPPAHWSRRQVGGRRGLDRSRPHHTGAEFEINGAAVTTTVSYLAKFGYGAIALRRWTSTDGEALPAPTPSAGGRH